MFLMTSLIAFDNEHLYQTSDFRNNMSEMILRTLLPEMSLANRFKNLYRGKLFLFCLKISPLEMHIAFGICWALRVSNVLDLSPPSRNCVSQCYIALLSCPAQPCGFLLLLLLLLLLPSKPSYPSWPTPALVWGKLSVFPQLNPYLLLTKSLSRPTKKIPTPKKIISTPQKRQAYLGSSSFSLRKAQCLCTTPIPIIFPSYPFKEIWGTRNSFRPVNSCFLLNFLTHPPFAIFTRCWWKASVVKVICSAQNWLRYKPNHPWWTPRWCHPKFDLLWKTATFALKPSHPG